jgi:DMSO/TMAO reductase YedYZ molybdopterin-dependent catalytic subunit
MDSKHLPDGTIISPDTQRDRRLPPNQSQTRKWPVLDASGPPQIDMDRWQFKASGLVDHELTFSWDEFQKLPRVTVFADFHCVTRWSKLDNLWEGVSTQEIMKRAGVQSSARFVLAYGYDFGWTTNMPLEHFASQDALFADTHDGAPISVEHGGPLRLIVPQLYAWKSAKWVKGVEFLEEDQAGYWEDGGYHMVGDPWKEQRFR